MQPQRIIGLILLVGGIVLLVMGLRAMDSFSSQFSEFFTGSPNDKAVWLTLGGVAAIIAGLGTAVVPSRVLSR